MLEGLQRAWWRHRLKDASFAHLGAPYDGDELVSIDCETTGLDVRRDQILSIGAIKLKGDTILTSQRLDFLVRPKQPVSERTILIHHIRPIDLQGAVPVDDGIRRVLEFIGPRPLVGYYLDFDVAMLDKYILPIVGIELPNRRIEVSRLYYDRKYGDAPPNTSIDLSFAAILRDLDIPALAQHDAFDDALMTAMMFVQLRDLAERGVRIPRVHRTDPVFNPTGG